MFATCSAAVTAINVDVVMLSHRLITRPHLRCLAGPPGWFCNVVCLPLQISIKAEHHTDAVVTVIMSTCVAAVYLALVLIPNLADRESPWQLPLKSLMGGLSMKWSFMTS